MIYFDNAATSGKKPQAVIDAVNLCLKRYSTNPGRSGHNLSISAAVAVYETRNKIAEFFGTSGAQKVIFTPNCTTALNYVIKGVLEKQDHVIVSELEHNAVMRPLHKTVKNYDVACVSLYDDEETLKNFEKLIKSDTKMIICTAASNVCGKMLPLKKIGELCKRRGIYFLVDAAQGAGVIPINIKEMNIDFLCIAPHKGMYAPMGIGILISEKQIHKTIIEGGTGTDSLNIEQPKDMPEMLESGTQNLPAIFGVSASIDFLKSRGIDRIYEHELSIIQKIYDTFSKDEDIVLYTPYPEKNCFAPVLSFNVLGKNSDETAEFLNKNGIYTRSGLHCAPLAHKKFGTQNTGTVRISTGYFNSRNDVISLINVVNNYKKVTKYYN